MDADSLKQVNLSLIKNREDIILTPHIFEFKSFFDIDEDINLEIDSYDFNKVDENISRFQQIARQIRGTVIVKGHYDLILSECLDGDVYIFIIVRIYNL